MCIACGLEPFKPKIQEGWEDQNTTISLKICFLMCQHDIFKSLVLQANGVFLSWN